MWVLDRLAIFATVLLYSVVTFMYTHMTLCSYTAVPPIISKMEYSAVGDGTYSIICTTTGSPPTTVSWMRNGDELTTSVGAGRYTSSQTVIDRPSSTYDNVLTIKGSYEDAVGDYSCDISNSLGATSANKTINGNENFVPSLMLVCTLL